MTSRTCDVHRWRWVRWWGQAKHQRQLRQQLQLWQLLENPTDSIPHYSR